MYKLYKPFNELYLPKAPTNGLVRPLGVCGHAVPAVEIVRELSLLGPASYQHNGPSPVLPVLFPGVREVEQRASGDLNPTDLIR